MIESITKSPESERHWIGIISETKTSYGSGSVNVKKVSTKHPKLSSTMILYVPKERLSNNILSIIDDITFAMYYF